MINFYFNKTFVLSSSALIKWVYNTLKNVSHTKMAKLKQCPCLLDKPTIQYLPIIFIPYKWFYSRGAIFVNFAIIILWKKIDNHINEPCDSIRSLIVFTKLRSTRSWAIFTNYISLEEPTYMVKSITSQYTAFIENTQNAWSTQQINLHKLFIFQCATPTKVIN